MLNRPFENRPSPAETVAGIEEAINLRAVLGPLLDLVEIVQVGD
jgi:hypothetical protein